MSVHIVVVIFNVVFSIFTHITCILHRFNIFWYDVRSLHKNAFVCEKDIILQILENTDAPADADMPVNTKAKQ